MFLKFHFQLEYIR